MWIRFWAIYGPGHQSYTEKYEYYPEDEQVDKHDLEDLWTEWAEGYGYRYMRGDAEVKVPTGKALQNIIETYENRLKRTQKMLVMLRTMDK